MEDSPAKPRSPNHCLNCGNALTGDFCGSCGQQVKELRRPFFRLCREALQSLFELDGRAYKTLFYLMTQPARLTREYFGGKRVSYTPPLRLFLVTSVAFFLLVSLYTSIQSLEGALNAPADEPAATVSPVPAETAANAADEGGDGIAGILVFIDQIELPFFTAQTNARLRSVMAAQAESNFAILIDDPARFARAYLEYITVFMLLMMPILALIQKLFYLGSGHYYSEHLVLTLHNHSFLIIAFFIASLASLVAQSPLSIVNSIFGYLEIGLNLWMWGYLYLSLKNYFQQGYGKTLLKFLTITICYGLVLGLGIFVFSIILFFIY